MPFTLTAFRALRPYLYHLTAAGNLPHLQRSRRLLSAAALAHTAGREDLITARRRVHTPLVVDSETIWLRDQAPLHLGNMALEPGWSFERFVAHLNQRVFFWPGNAAGPISYGMRHFGRYATEQPIILRVSVDSLLAVNANAAFEFSRCNSGSPRYNRGRAGPRGGHTFLSSTVAPYLPRDVVEVTALGAVLLPDDTQRAATPAGVWEQM